MKIETDDAMPISIRGEEIIGIDWQSPGKSSITAPWISYHPPGEQIISVNGKSLSVTNSPVDLDNHIRSGVINPDVYIPTFSWLPTQPTFVRRNLLALAIAYVLILFAIKLINFRSLMTLTAIGAVTTGFILVALFDNDFHHDVLARYVEVRDQTFIQWQYFIHTRTGRFKTQFNPTTQILFPQSLAHLAALDPVLELSSSGEPTDLNYSSSANEPVCFYGPAFRHKTLEGVDPGIEKIISPELIRSVYGRDYVVENNVMVLKPINR